MAEIVKQITNFKMTFCFNMVPVDNYYDVEFVLTFLITDLMCFLKHSVYKSLSCFGNNLQNVFHQVKSLEKHMVC